VIRDWAAKYGGIKTDPNHPARRADALLVEEKGSGISLIQDLRGANIPAVSYNPGRASKTARAHLVAPTLEIDVFYILESKRDPGEYVTWARDFVAQLEQFPNGEHDDYVDTFTQVAIYLLRTDQLQSPEAAPDIEEERDYHASKPRVNPYGV
jgi:predicted phage terminase large subunit-like protein